MIRNRLKIEQISFFFFTAVLLFFPNFIISAQELFWENPELLVENNVWFPLTAFNEESSIIMWQEFDESDNGSAEMSISLMTAADGKNWNKSHKVLGPFPFTGDKVSVSSLAVDASGLIYIAVASSSEGILIYSSSNDGESFKLIGKPGGKETTTVSPKLFVTGSNSLILFVTQSIIEDRTAFNQESTLGITYSVSSNGRSWTDYVPMVSGSSLSNVYLPFHVSDRNIEHVVFQASSEESRFYQLYHISSRDRGLTWSTPSLITNIAENGNRSVDFDNQRAFLKESRGNLYILWERKLGNGYALSYYGELNSDTGVLDRVEAISGDGISTNSVNNPQLYINRGIPVALWYNNIGQVVLAGRKNNEWTGIDIPGQVVGGLSNFCRFLSVGNEMNIVWQSDIGDKYSLTRLTQDKTVSDITVFPVNFKSSALSQDRYTVTWNLPSDSSGIAGFSYSLDRNERGTSPQTIMVRRRDERKVSFTTIKDGSWYIHVRAVDYAGNWSTPSTVKFIRDTTPPGRVVFNMIETDDAGYLLSNTGSLGWEAPVGEEAAGYSYRIQYLANPAYSGDFSEFNILDTPNRSVNRDTSYSFYNQDNGFWSFTVTAFDSVGNRGDPETLFLGMNKYIPVTYITSLSAVQDDLGAITIRILGRGFSIGGTINTIILDRDKTEPFDYVLNPAAFFSRGRNCF